MVETEDIQNLLQRGSWTTSRAKSPKPFETPTTPARANQSSKLDPHVPRSFNLALHHKRFPPPPTVEDEAESLAKEHGSTGWSGTAEEAQFRGEVEQHPILVPVHEYNPERRFVLVSNGSEDSESDEGSKQGRDKKKADYEANTGRKVAASHLAPGDVAQEPAKPGLERRKSRQDLPRIDTEMRQPAQGGRLRSKSNVTIDQQRQEPQDYFSRREDPRRSDDLLSPTVKHTSKGRDRPYWDLNNGGDPRTAPVRDDRRGPSADDRWNVPQSSKSPVGHRRQQSDAPKYSRHMSDQGRYHEEIAYSGGRRRESSPPDLRRKHSSPPRVNRKSNSPPYPQSARESRESIPGRTPSYRRRQRSPVPEEDDYLSDDRKAPRPPRSRRTTVGQESRSSMLIPDIKRTPSSSNRPRSKATTPIPSPRISQVDQFSDSEPLPRSPRSATFPKENPGRRYDDERPVSPFSPVDDAPRNKARLGDGERSLRPGVTSRTSTNGNSSGLSSVPIPIPIPMNNGDSSPVERRRSPLPGAQSRHSSFEDSPPKSNWQPPSFNPAEYKSHLDKPIQSYRRHSEDIQRGLIPKLPECSRKASQPGHDDWLTIARAENFDICPDCYTSVFSLTNFTHDFVLAPPRPRDRPVNCDFGSSIWYRIAFLMTIKHGYADLRLLKNVAAAAARYTPCAGARNDTRVWYSIVDPHARRPIPSFSACHCCARSIEALFPNLAGAFVPLDSTLEPSRGLCSMHYLPGRKRFDDFVDLFETTSDRAVSRKSPPDLQWLADKVREKSLDDECMRNLPVVNQKWHVMDSIPHFTVCAECFDTVVWPMIEGEPSNVARNFLQQKQRKQVGSCQLYSERMREVFRKACRRNDIEYLEDNVTQRTRAMQDIRAKNEVLSRQDPLDPRTKEEGAELLKELKSWE